ncbi:alginate export family protein [Thalassotalea castellviae]|uniref:Alginate export family protein n=1 Tax=Thalassotalea castellviae TaxID=3075612 RepID=A0ABU2ZXM6_9GAMM|nr:alginate export family protein [Thalassotalea sp. W431]MDT0602680.1 alginate export family protein [Thalassotalea sp. W431]
MKLNKTTLYLAVALASSYSTTVMANDISTALANGKATVDLNLRYESVDQDNALKKASALTLRTRLSYASKAVNGFSSLVEFEDSRNVLGINDYKNTLGRNNDYSVIADPETTELDQMLLQYKQANVTAKLGRQVITMDNHRFVGHVGWRQDRQTFDGISFDYQASEKLSLKYAYITQRNRIFADAKDIDSKDHLINASYKTGAGTVTAYSYLLEIDNDIDNALDTYGIRFNGASKFDSQKFTYSFDYALQDTESAGTSFSSHYLSAELGTHVSGLGLKVGYELLGSDEGMYGFSTPLATLHKFNGWSDQFLTTPKEGLTDLYASLSGKVLEGKWAVIYHNFNADKASDTVDDFGSEINAVYTKKFSKHYTAGIKYSAYSAGDVATGKVDTDKLWLWISAKF